MKIIILRTSNRTALKRDIQSRRASIGKVLRDSRNGGFHLTTANGSALITP